MSPVYRVSLAAPDDLDGFRVAARGLLGSSIPPESVAWCEQGAADLFGDTPPTSDTPLMVPSAFAPIAADVICHRDPERFTLLYAALWRIAKGERGLLDDIADPLVHRLAMLQKAVRRDVHKMTAFVRFRRVEIEGVECYVAWFEPEHHILGRAAPFFRDRFAGMRWSILTPGGSLHWDGRTLTRGPGVGRAEAPSEDALEAWWRTYYRATFNPARANPIKLRAEMPKKYWHNLPEASLIPELLADANARTGAMLDQAPMPARKAKVITPELPMPAVATSLGRLAAEARDCERCPLYGNATQTVFGEGPRDAPVVFVGEQPGDQEDLAGKPFVGPAGQMFDRALADAGLDRSRAYVTNAVKHFKFELRGKRRLHKKPKTSEIDACRWWLDRELAAIEPQLTVALGATAARALAGRAVTISRERGHVLELRPGVQGLITVHPSFLLRLPDEAAKKAEYAAFVRDLRVIARQFPAMRAAA